MFSCPQRRLIEIASIAAITLPIAACDQSTKNETPKIASVASFSQVCNKVPVDSAPAYTKGNPGRTVAFFERKDPQSTFEYQIYSELPGTWNTSADNFRENQLVICVEKQGEKKVKTCDGYKVEDDKTKEVKPAKVELYDVDYEFVAYEAKTAKVLGTKTVNAKVDQECPSVVIFTKSPDKQEYVSQQHAKYRQTLLEFTQSHL